MKKEIEKLYIFDQIKERCGIAAPI